MGIELCRIMDSDQVPEGTLTRMVGVHPVRWRDVTLGAIPEPTLVAVEDEKAEAAVRLAELLGKMPGGSMLVRYGVGDGWALADRGAVMGVGDTPLAALEAALGKEE